MADRFDMACGVMHRAFEGEWVKHGDYQRETAQLQARVAELEGALAVEREACAVTAWAIGMEKHMRGDTRELGSLIARAIRERGLNA